MSRRTAQTKSMSKQGACVEYVINRVFATLKVCVCECLVDNATPPDLTVIALQKVAQGTHANKLFGESQMCQKLQQYETSCLMINQAWWVN